MHSACEVLELLSEMMAAGKANPSSWIFELAQSLANVLRAEKAAESWKQIHLVLTDSKLTVPSELKQKLIALDVRLNVSSLPSPLLSLAYVSFSEATQAFHWLTEPNVGFEFKTPCEYAKLSESGLFAVEQYLRMLKARAI